MNNDDGVTFHYNNDEELHESSGSDRSEPIKRSESTRTFIVTVPGDKNLKVPPKCIAKELNIEDTIDDILLIIEAGEKASEIINTVNVTCCSSGSCYKLFSKCFKLRISENKATIV